MAHTALPAMAEKSEPSIDDIIASADSNAIQQLRDKDPNELIHEIMTRIAVLNEQNKLRDEIEQPAAGNAANDEQQGNLSISRTEEYYKNARALGIQNKRALETCRNSSIEYSKTMGVYEGMQKDAEEKGGAGLRHAVRRGWTDGHK